MMNQRGIESEIAELTRERARERERERGRLRWEERGAEGKGGNE